MSKVEETRKVLDELNRKIPAPTPAKNALIARCPNCGRAVYAAVEVVVSTSTTKGAELLELLIAGFDLVHTDVETARGLFGCECGMAVTQEAS